jgi:hypothetical protein
MLFASFAGDSRSILLWFEKDLLPSPPLNTQASQWSHIVLLVYPPLPPLKLSLLSHTIVCSFLCTLMTASDAADPAAMLRHFFNSCFQKRSDRSHPKSSHIEGSDETDGSDPALISLQTTPHFQSVPIRDGPKVSAQEKTKTGSQTSAATQNPAMPKAAKKTKAAPKSVKDRKPYLRAQPATRSEPMSLAAPCI